MTDKLSRSEPDITFNYHKGQDTSRQANASIAKDKDSLRNIIYRVVMAGEKGRTCEEVEFITGLKHQTASARITELCVMGWIHFTNHRRVTASGRAARVYFVTPPMGPPGKQEELF